MNIFIYFKGHFNLEYKQMIFCEVDPSFPFKNINILVPRSEHLGTSRLLGISLYYNHG